MPWVDCLGFAAALSVVTSFCMTTILALRVFALFSNVLFIFYGALGHIYPVLCLHVILLPVNVAKLYGLQNHHQTSSFFGGPRIDTPPPQPDRSQRASNG